MHHKAPHRPWVPDERHRHLYADGQIPEPDTFDDDYATARQAAAAVQMPSPRPERDGPQDSRCRRGCTGRRTVRPGCGGSTSSTCATICSASQSIDDNVGRLLDYLEGSGLAENTLVVYTSDQGFFLGDHGWFDKRLMFEESLQMPMLVRWPAEIEPGTRCGAIITNVDFAATLLDVCGIDAREALPTSQGRSFRPLLRGEQVEDWPDAAYYRYWEHDDSIHAAPAHYGIRTAAHKLIHYYGAGLGVPGASDRVLEPEWELYDLSSDPTEVRNVAADPAYATVRAELEAQLAEYQRRYADHPYTGPDTPVPRWGPSAEELAERTTDPRRT